MESMGKQDKEKEEAKQEFKLQFDSPGNSGVQTIPQVCKFVLSPGG